MLYELELHRSEIKHAKLHELRLAMVAGVPCPSEWLAAVSKSIDFPLQLAPTRSTGSWIIADQRRLSIFYLCALTKLV